MLRHDHLWLPCMRVAWLLENGTWPQGHVVPRNGDPDDTRWENIALASELSDAARTKVCAECGESFVSRYNSGRFCSMACSRKFRTGPPLTLDERRARERRARLAQKYGLTLEAFEAMLREQGQVCAICRMAPDTPPVVDHCHETGVVRGILCVTCNAGLGMFKDDPVRLSAALAYLRR